MITSMIIMKSRNNSKQVKPRSKSPKTETNKIKAPKKTNKKKKCNLL